MSVLLNLKRPTIIDKKTVLVGNNRDKDIGAKIYVPDGEVTILDGLEITNVFIGVIKTGNGKLVLTGDVVINNFGGDSLGIRGSNIHFENDSFLRTYGNTPTRPYNTCFRDGDESINECLSRNNESVFDVRLLSWSKDNEGNEFINSYHQDTILQAFAVKRDGYTLDNDGIIETISIPRMDIVSSGVKSQGLMCSEKCRISNWDIGTEYLRIRSDYKYPIVFNNIDNSRVGCVTANMVGFLKIKNVKGSKHKSKNNVIKGLKVIGDFEKEVENEMKDLVVEYENDTVGEISMTLKEHAERLNIEHEVLIAIMNQESGGKFFRLGMPVILFECHVFDRALRRAGKDPSEIVKVDRRSKDIICYTPYKKYGSYKKQIKRYELARSIDEVCAIQACSWGKFQILGENYKMCGFDTAEDFMASMYTEQGQINVFIAYVESKKGLVSALRNKKWDVIKRLYQGSRGVDRNHDGVDDYVASLIRHYTRAVQRASPRKKVHKSRTMRNNATGAIVKGIAGTTVLAGADPIFEAVNKMSAQIERLESVKETATTALTKVGEMSSDLVNLQGKVEYLSWMPLALGVLLIISIIPHIRVGIAYMQDNGYLNTNGDLDEY